MELKNILIIEDDSTLRDSVIGEFQTKGINVQAGEPGSLDEYLATPHQFQLVILDWLLYGDSSDLAKVCLQKIRQAYFVPVVIWTGELKVFENELEDVKKIFPEACLHAKSKDEIGYQELLDVLIKWHERTPAKLREEFRRSIIASAEEALYRLAEHSEDDLARGLKALITLGDTSEIDIEHAVDVLLRLVGRVIYTDQNFIDTVKQTVTELELQNPPKTKQEIKTEKRVESRIKELHMYYTPSDNTVRVGDIIEIKIGNDEQAKLFKGIVITPACDLARPRTAFLRLALIQERTTDDTPGADKFILSFLEDDKKIFEVCLHELLVIENQILTANTPVEQQKPVMLYKHHYQTLTGEPVSLKPLRRLDEPYRADLLHCFVSHAGRIGVPEFKAAI